MASGSSTHGQYLTLLRVSGVGAGVIDKAAQEIHDAYMEQFGPLAAFTAGLFELTGFNRDGSNVDTPGNWNYVIRYFGPSSSVAWLQQKFEDVARSVKATVVTETYTVRDITGRY